MMNCSFRPRGMNSISQIPASMVTIPSRRDLGSAGRASRSSLHAFAIRSPSFQKPIPPTDRSTLRTSSSISSRAAVFLPTTKIE
jgi:hypothetical protein